MTSHRQPFWRLAVCFAGAWLITGCGSEKIDPAAGNARTTGGTLTPSSPASDPVQAGNHLTQARRWYQLGDWESAATSAYRALVQNPDDADAKLIASEIEAARGNHQAAVDLARSIDVRSRLGYRASEIQVQQLVKLNRVSEAADVILMMLKLAPDGDRRFLAWRRELWGLLCRVGRRQEASQQVDRLCLAGQANQAELLSLARRNSSFPFSLKPGSKPEDIFLRGLGMARWYFTKKEYRRALEELAGQSETGFESPAACALYGRLLVETQTLDALPQWFASCDAKTREFSDYWIALGTYFFDQHQYEACARALLEASVRDPTDYACVNRLAKVFEALDDNEKSEQFRHRAALVYQVEHFAKQTSTLGDGDQKSGVTPLLLELGRPFEAIGWTLLTLPQSDAGRRAAVSQQLVQLSQDPNALAMASRISLVGIDPARFSLEAAIGMLRQSSNPTRPVVTSARQLAPPRLVDVAASVNLDFQWYQDLENNLTLIPLHELMGGGIAILDYDLDGWPDIYMAQGAGEPPSDTCARSNVLFRNLDASFEPVTPLAEAEDYNYSSGLAAGDVNQDGFVDLYVGSLGRNRLLINNGDGTFREATEQMGKIEDRFTSSLAIADLNGDAIPDLFEAVYVEMEGGFDPPDIGEDGGPMQPSPILHYAQSDRWLENKGDTSFQPREITSDVATPGTSLGVIVTDFDSNGSNEIFVGNDARSNHFLVQSGENQFLNTAGVKGIASGFSGEAEACMGIATGDFDRDGSIDLHITNYSDESANHYSQTTSGAFTDLAIRYGIDTLTKPYIGFGVKAVDVDRNGWSDLIVTNGHVFDLRKDGKEFEMPPQFLANLGDRFQLMQVDDDSGYWEGKYLGRTIAMTDFDRDGAIDFLVGHLHGSLALLHNQTASPGSWVQFELAGTESERDAIGARIVVTMKGGQSFTQWVTAGDGYLCSDEPVVDFGLGELQELERVEVYWPSGRSQTFQDLNVGHRYLLIEGQPDVFQR